MQPVIHDQRSPELLTPDTLAEFLGVPVATVYRWRTRGVGPRGLKVGRHVRYRRADVEAWLDSRAATGGPDAA